jgi:hypothetical protein
VHKTLSYKKCARKIKFTCGLLLYVLGKSFLQVKKTKGGNFTNILRSESTCKSVMEDIILLLHFVFVIFERMLAKKLLKKCWRNRLKANVLRADFYALKIFLQLLCAYSLAFYFLAK